MHDTSQQHIDNKARNESEKVKATEEVTSMLIQEQFRD